MKSKKPSKPQVADKTDKYTKPAQVLEEAICKVGEAEVAVRSLELLTPDDEAKIDELVGQEVALQPSPALRFDGTVWNLEQIRYRIRSQHPVEVRNEAKRRAVGIARSELDSAMQSFYDVLKADLNNPAADVALDRLKRYGGDPLSIARMMVSMTESLNAPEQSKTQGSAKTRDNTIAKPASTERPGYDKAY